MSNAMSLKRPPNELESKLHQAALSAPKKELTAKQAESLIPDPVHRQNALNFLLGVGLFKGLVVQGADGKSKGKAKEVVFRAVGKEEADTTKGLSGEENLVLSHIKSAGNEGIWTKHLKSKTSLHQTIIDRCLKTLTQKRLIKRVQSVQHITRKIYMLEGLDPSSALTGGPWYTDNELDAEFIRGVGEGCWRLVWDISFPKRRTANLKDRVLYPPSNAPAYPTAEQIRNALKKARLTDTDLTVEHVEMVLNVLVLDGKIERLPAFSFSLWNDHDNEESGDEDDTIAKRKRKKRDSDSDSDEHRSRKKKRRKDDESESESDERDRRKGQRKKKQGPSLEDGSGSESESGARKKKKSKRSRSTSSSSSPSPSPSKRRMGRLDRGIEGGTVYRALLEPPSVAAASGSGSTTKSAAHLLGGMFGGGIFGSEGGRGGGMMDGPCGTCPVFEFCKDGGPVNPRECVYYEGWMGSVGKAGGGQEEIDVKMEG